MQVAIVVSQSNTVPTIFCEETQEALLERLNTLNTTPALPNATKAREWLASQPEPSGWFMSLDEAHAYLDRMRQKLDMTADEVRVARDRLGLTRAAFASAIGFGGNGNTRHKSIFEIENGKKRLNPERTRTLRALLSKHALREIRKDT